MSKKDTKSEKMLVAFSKMEMLELERLLPSNMGKSTYVRKRALTPPADDISEEINILEHIQKLSKQISENRESSLDPIFTKWGELEERVGIMEKDLKSFLLERMDEKEKMQQMFQLVNNISQKLDSMSEVKKKWWWFG